MNALITRLEKMKPFFNKITDNMYMTSIRNGFMAPMYVILFSSVFMLVAFIPNAWGFYWSAEITGMLMRPYNFTMGFFGFIICMTVTKALTDEVNKRKMSKKDHIDVTATMIAAVVSYLIILGDSVKDAAGTVVQGAMSTSFMGAGGIFAGLIIAFTIPNIYVVFIKRDITIHLPDSVPPSISESFKSLFAFSFSVLVFCAVDIIFRNTLGYNIAAGLTKVLAPLFVLGDSYGGVAILAFALSFLWFLGIHGPSVVMPALAPIMIANFASNQELYAAGQQAASPFTSQLQTFIACFGGTGATFVTVFMFAFLSKSKGNKAVGRAALFPTICSVNEPILFGAPLILNPVFFVPFIVAPIFNAVVFKFFVSSLGMNGFIINVPWTTPGPIAIPLGTGLVPLSFLLVAIIVVVDFIIYYPFFKAYDIMKIEDEKETERKEALEAQKTQEIIKNIKKATPVTDDISSLNGKSVLVLCIGGGTSGMLANALNKAAEEYHLTLTAGAAAYGTHEDIIGDYDLVILAPQAQAYYDTLKGSTDKLGIKLATTTGPQYVELSRDTHKALQFTKACFQKK